jgi:thiol-disulfide isomerase/thioredoxin
MNKSVSDLLLVFFWIIVIYLFLNHFLTYDSKKEEFSESKIKIYNFNTTWCGYSKQFQPIWDEFTESLTDSDNVEAIDAKCDDDKYSDLMEKYNVDGFPTVVIVIDGEGIKYDGPRTVKGLRKALNLDSSNIKETEVTVDKPIKCGGDNKKKKVSFNSDKVILYNFNTTWCGYSKQFQPVWDEFYKKYSSDSLEIIDAKCDNDDFKDLCEKYNVEGFPTVIKVTSTGFKHYNGHRTVKGLNKFANEN